MNNQNNLYRPKDSIDRCLTLDIADLLRSGVLKYPGCEGIIRFSITAIDDVISFDVHFSLSAEKSGLHEIRLEYTRVDLNSEQKVSQKVKLQLSKPHFGGSRNWFTCPLNYSDGCNERVRKLYLPPLETRFGCRTCHDLAYRRRLQDSITNISDPKIIITNRGALKSSWNTTSSVPVKSD